MCPSSSWDLGRVWWRSTGERLTDEIYKRISNNHLMFSGMVVEELRGSFRVQFMQLM